MINVNPSHANVCKCYDDRQKFTSSFIFYFLQCTRADMTNIVGMSSVFNPDNYVLFNFGLFCDIFYFGAKKYKTRRIFIHLWALRFAIFHVINVSKKHTEMLKLFNSILMSFSVFHILSQQIISQFE